MSTNVGPFWALVVLVLAHWPNGARTQEFPCISDGECERGPLLGQTFTETTEECLQECSRTANCNVYTHFRDLGLCELYSYCDEIDATYCNECVTGYVICDATSQYSRFMVVGGYNAGRLDSVELFDLSGHHEGCEDPAPFPVAIQAPVGVFYLGEVWICSGDTGAAYEKRCWTYDNTNDAWVERDDIPMAEGRSFAAGVLTREDEWLITGGETSRYLDSGERLVQGRLWVPEVLPNPDGISSHCMVKVNDNNVMLIGGKNNRFYLAETWMYDIQRDIWRPLPPMTNGRAWLHCGLVKRTRPDGSRATEVVAMGGATYSTIYSEVEIFDVETETWSYADQNFPLFFDHGKTAQFRDTFIVVGGYDDYNNDYMPAIWQYEPEDQSWTLFGHSLKTPRYDHVVIPVPDSVGKCWQ